MSTGRFYIPLLLLAMLVLLWLRLPDWFSHGNTRFIEPFGDGYKAYHAIFYHAEHDTTYSHFAGMNYPYGDHVVPGACQPLISNSLRLLDSVGLNMQSYKLGVLHASMLLGIVLCALFLYLILVRLKLPPWYSLLFAVPLTFLAPQQARLLAHYGLAHPELLPILFYLLLRWHEKMIWGWSLGIGAIVGLYSGIHFYYFAIASFAIFGWVAVRWVSRRDWRATLSYLGHGLLMLGLPLLFYVSWMILPDTVEDRNPVPWGFFEFRANWTGTFTDIDQPHWQGFNKIYPLLNPNYEAQNYVGLLAITFVGVSLLWLLLGHWRRPRIAVVDEGGRFVNYLYLSSILILVFSFGVPFTFAGWENFLHYAGPIQQFRSIGRFAWIFYFSVNIAAVYYLWQWASTKQPMLRTGVIILSVAIVSFESYRHHTSLPLELDEIEHWAKGTTFYDMGIDPEDYQACLPIPYFNIGSGNFWWEPTGWCSQKPHTISMQTGLPLTSAMLTRTSLRQTIDQFQLVNEPYRLPRILQDYPNDKPILMFWDKERIEEFGDRYSHLLSGGTSLKYEEDWMQLYELPLTSFATRLATKITAVEASVDTLFQHASGVYTTDSLTQYFYRDFDDHKNTPAYRGAGEFRGPLPQVNYLVDEIWDTDFTGNLNLSFWMHLNVDRAARSIVTWEEYDASGQLIGQQQVPARQTFRVVDDQGWALISLDLIKRQPYSRVRVTLHNDEVIAGDLQIDDLLLRPANAQVAWRSEEELWWNNRVYLKK